MTVMRVIDLAFFFFTDEKMTSDVTDDNILCDKVSMEYAHDPAEMQHGIGSPSSRELPGHSFSLMGSPLNIRICARMILAECLLIRIVILNVSILKACTLYLTGNVLHDTSSH